MSECGSSTPLSEPLGVASTVGCVESGGRVEVEAAVDGTGAYGGGIAS